MLKCTFFQSEVKFLGMTVSGQGITMSKDKFAVITEWKPLMCIKGIHSFLRLANFYQWFIADFAAVTKLLTLLTKKDMLFIWGVNQQLVFDTLKTKFTSAPILTFPNPIQPMQLKADASSYAIGAALVVHHKDSWKPVAYMSHSCLVPSWTGPCTIKSCLR